MGKKSRRKNNRNDTSSSSLNNKNNTNAQIDNPYHGSYVVAPYDFRHLPRWPNDGIEKTRQKNQSGEFEKFQFDIDPRDIEPDQIALTELLGGYPVGKPLTPLGPNDNPMSCFIRNLPFQMQSAAANEQSDLSSARNHLIEAYKSKDIEVNNLLDKINCKKAIYKASLDPSRFPDLRAILVPLFQKNIASDSNIEVLFGRVSYIRHLLLDIGADFAVPPPRGSPAAASFSKFLQHDSPDAKLESGAKLCAECKCESLEDVTLDFKKCSACKTVHYCDADCQRKHWPIHRPDCFQAQGKPVSSSMIAKAEKTIKEREEFKIQQAAQRDQELQEDFIQTYAEFENELPSLCDSWAHDIRGKRLRIHVPYVNAHIIIKIVGSAYVELKDAVTLSLGMYPDGIDYKKYGFRGIDFTDSNGARIIVLFEFLWSQGGCGPGVGLHVDGVFVVDKVVKNRAKWKLVPEPIALYQPDHNRQRRLTLYLETAKNEAKVVPGIVDLGIHNPGDPDLTILGD